MAERLAIKESREELDCQRPLKAYLMELNGGCMGVESLTCLQVSHILMCGLKRRR